MCPGKYTTFFALLAIFMVAAAEDSADQTIQNVGRSAGTKDLLSTLQDLRHSLTNQISALKSSTAEDRSVKSHLVQHYTAQKNNIEHEISLIESLERSPPSDAVPRHILQSLGAEEKIVPSIINIFKKTPKPSNDAPSHDFGYSFPQSYPSYYYPGYPAYPGYGPQFPYPYQGVPPPLKPNHLNMDNLVQSTFAGYETNNTNSQTFLTRNQLPGESATEPRPSPPQPAAAPQVSLQGEVPSTPQAQSTYNPQPNYRPQQTYSPQPGGAVQQPPIPPMAPQNGMGVFVYYPNAVITEDDEPEERPSIVDRVGQAFDRFGQVITNLASLRSAGGKDGILANSASATRLRVHQNRPRSSTSSSDKARALDEIEGSAIRLQERRNRLKSSFAEKAAKTVDERRPKLRWVAV